MHMERCIYIIYLEQRFSLSVRIIVTIVFSLIYTIFMAVILYGPSSALSQVTGLHTWLTIGSCGLICTLYTSIGGMKAVIWTDVSQSILMFLGCIDAGGIAKVFQTAMAGDRINFFIVAWINYALFVTMLILCAGVGFVLYATYSHCDPLRANLISKPDQLYPLFVIQTFGRFPGLTGLFVAKSREESGFKIIATISKTR
ncbi:unnamed protein product [Rotaria sordida]|uniref:Uncharacterized protein n=1 Tax=Rotaria sordida TaxID=392033 RepID=A0A814VA01_9BILA|nr:unnamed protein product [Rotaria sordida]CAF1449634.1 unnamed protein product [Rotaria sordida]